MPRRTKRGDTAPQENVVGVFPIVIEGNIRALPAQVEDGRYQPSIALWVDARSSLVLAFQLIDPRETPDGGVSEAWAALQTALMSPHLGASSGMDGSAPVLVRTSVTLAAALKPHLPQHVRVEPVADLPIFDEVFADLADTLLKATPRQGEPFDWEIDPALLKPLFKAAAEYARRQPWTFLPDDPPLAVVLGSASPLEGVDTLYGSVLGAGGEVYGIAYYLSLDEYRSARQEGTELEMEDDDYEPLLAQLRATGAPVDEVPPATLRQMLRSLRALADDESPTLAGEPPQQECLACLLDPYEEADPDYLRWLEERQISGDPEQWVPTFVRTGHESPPRDPDGQEAQALTLALAATNQFLSKHRHLLRRMFLPDGGLHHVAQVGGKTRGVAIELHMPPAGYEYTRDLAWLDRIIDE